MDANPIHILLLDLEDHLGYVRDAKEDIKNGGQAPSVLLENLAEAERQVEEIRKQIRELS